MAEAYAEEVKRHESRVAAWAFAVQATEAKIREAFEPFGAAVLRNDGTDTDLLWRACDLQRQKLQETKRMQERVLKEERVELELLLCKPAP